MLAWPDNGRVHHEPVDFDWRNAVREGRAFQTLLQFTHLHPADGGQLDGVYGKCVLVSVAPAEIYRADLVVDELPAVEDLGRGNQPLADEVQVLGTGKHTQLFPQFPEGGWNPIDTGRDVARAGDIVAAGEGILVGAPLLEQDLETTGLGPAFADEPDMGGPVQDALPMGFLPVHGLPRGIPVAVHNIEDFRRSSRGVRVCCFLPGHAGIISLGPRPISVWFSGPAAPQDNMLHSLQLVIPHAKSLPPCGQLPSPPPASLATALPVPPP